MTDSSQNQFEFPEAATGQSKWSLFLIWLIPVIVAIIGISLAARAIIERGPTITIAFKTAEGLEAGKTKIKYKNVDIGDVKSITLKEDRSQVLVTAQLTKAAENFLDKNTRFWVVRPRVAGGNVSGLSTLLSGSYIGVDAGKSNEKQDYFIGLETPPVITTDLPGREFLLRGNDLGSLDIGAPIFFRRIEVGQVLAYEIEKDGKGVKVRIFINSPYDKYVRKNSQFWHATGFDATLDVNGFRLDSESLATIIIGGVAFQTPTESPDAPIAEKNHMFTLSADRIQAMKAPDTYSETYKLVFEESVRGLSQGAPVDFRGVTVGEVASVNIDYDPQTGKVVIPVEIHFYPDRLHLQYRKSESETSSRDALDRLVQNGLRAQLRAGNLVTQQLFVALDFFPDASKAKIDWKQSPAQIPTVIGSIEELQASLTRLLKKLEKVPFSEIGEDARKSLQGLNTTLQKTDKLIENVNTEVVPEMKATLKDAREAINSIESAISSDSPLQQDMHDTLRDVSRASRSLRTLTDYLERHPEALLRGKPKEE